MCGILLLLAGCQIREPAARGPKVGNFALLDQTGTFRELYYYSDFRAVVLFVHGLGCQIVRNQIPALSELHQTFEVDGGQVKFLGINANPQDDRDSVARNVEDLGIPFPVLLDESQHVARSLELERTGEAILIETASWSIVYRGPIDDRLDYGVQRTRATTPLLRSAIESVLAGRVPSQPPVTSPGCLIQFRELASADLSFSDSVVPILRRHCLSCHREGGPGPFAMDSYRSLYGWAPMIREVVRTRRMPPWSLDPHVGDFTSPDTLTPEEERVLLGWVDAGSPGPTSGDPLAAEKTTPSGTWTLGEPDLVLSFDEQQIPATGVVPYRYSVARLGLKEKAWIAAAEVQGSDPEVLHHAFVFVGDNVDVARNYRTWFRHIFSTYAPGVGPDVFPPDTGYPLGPGGALLLQMHYTPKGRAVSDRPRLGLYFCKSPPAHEARVTALINYSFRIPPGAQRWPVHSQRELERDILLYSIRPHMHYRGRAMRVWVTLPGAEKELILNVPDYQFDWQSRYVLSDPLFLPAGSLIEAESIFDNSAQNRYNPDPSRTVSWGNGQVADEMHVVYLHHVRWKGKPPVQRISTSSAEASSPLSR